MIRPGIYDDLYSPEFRAWSKARNEDSGDIERQIQKSRELQRTGHRYTQGLNAVAARILEKDTNERRRPMPVVRVPF